MKVSHRTVLILMCLAVLVSMTFNLAIGSAKLPIYDVMACLGGTCRDEFTEILVWEIRLPRMLLAFVVGAGLAWSGAILQNCTRNPLADPYLFGVVSGAGFGVTLALLLVPESLYVLFPIFAFLGALGAILLVMLLMRVLVNDEQVVLLGVAVAFLLGAMTQFLLYVGDPLASNRIIFWLLGSFSGAGMSQMWLILSVLLVVSGISIAGVRQLNALLLDNDSARALGVDIVKVRKIYFVLCALLTAFIVAYCGGIGFVGLMVPHIVRLFFGASAGKLLFGSLFLGGIFMLWVDVAARNILDGQEIPLGVITGLLGSVFFMALLIKRKVT